MARVIGEVRPRFVFVENSPLLVSRGLDRVLADLAALGYDARWGIVGAHHAGAPHKRDRIWILANSEDYRPRWGQQLQGGSEEERHVADSMPPRERGKPRKAEAQGDALADANNIMHQDKEYHHGPDDCGLE